MTSLFSIWPLNTTQPYPTMTSNNNHRRQHVILNLLLSLNQTKSLEPKPNHSNPKQTATHLSSPLTKPNHPNLKPMSHKPNVVVDLTSSTITSRTHLLPLRLPPVSCWNNQKGEEKKLRKRYMNKEKKRWKWIVYFDSLLQVCLGSSLAQVGRRVRTTLDLPTFASPIEASEPTHHHYWNVMVT